MFRKSVLILAVTMMFLGCSTSRQATEPAPDPKPEAKKEKVDFSTLLEPPEDWHHLDEEQSQFRGISSRLAYETLLGGRPPAREVIVAVIDGGTDVEHEDLKESLWINEGEAPDNGRDDDGNGYVDDIHGWNFIGGSDGRNVDHDTFELTRIYRRLQQQFANADTASMNDEEKGRYAYYEDIRSDYEQKVREYNQQYNNIESLVQAMQQAEEILDRQFGDQTYSYEDLQDLEPYSQELQFAKNVMSYVMENRIDSAMIAEQKKQIYEFAKYGYNPDFRTRHIVGDNYEDKTERYYGNNDVAGPDPDHGTHVAGIIAAGRNNETGMDGVTANARIMVIRAVPNGDERDKDVANAIRYAVDNGAQVINMSFGKAYSPHKDVVDEAIKYADERGVLMVHGAGNESKNTDRNPSFPTDEYGSFTADSTASLWLGVGATSWKPDEAFIAEFSNYGSRTVDLFAPGVAIYSTMPGDKYERQDGTSMAAPVVTGVAALLMAYYPDLSARQVKQIILENTVQYPGQEVYVPEEGGPQEETELRPFSSFSASGGVVNVYKALQAAEKLQE